MNAIYARQSLDKKNSISIETQIEFALRTIPGEPHQIYIDKGYSGGNTKRPEFMRMMKDIKAGKIKKVIVYKIDRLSRNVLEFSVMWHELNTYGVEFVSVSEQFDTSTPIGKAMLFMAEIFAQLERETDSVRVTDNYYERIKEGRWPGGPAPFGWKNSAIVYEGVDKPIKIPIIEPNEYIAEVVEWFTLYASGNYSLRKIAGIANEKGVANKKWVGSVIRGILMNPVFVKADADIYMYYKSIGVRIESDLEQFDGTRACTLLGKYTPDDKKRANEELVVNIALWPGVIPSDIWLACQHRLSLNRQIKNGGKGKYTWLSGKIKCGECNHSVQFFPHISRKSGEMRGLLVCSGHCAKFCDHVVKMRPYDLEDIIAAEIKIQLSEAQNDAVEEEIFTISPEDKIELVQIDEKISNLLNCIATGEASDLTVTMINRELEKLATRQKELASHIGHIKKNKVQYKPIDFDELSFEEKKMVVNDYIDKILLFENGDVEIVWNV